MHYAVIWPTKRSFMIISSIWPKIWTLRNLFMESIANGGHRLLDTTVVEVFLIIIFLGSIFIIILVVIIIGWMTFPIRAFPSQIWFKVKSSQVKSSNRSSRLYHQWYCLCYHFYFCWRQHSFDLSTIMKSTHEAQCTAEAAVGYKWCKYHFKAGFYYNVITETIL